MICRAVLDVSGCPGCPGGARGGLWGRTQPAPAGLGRSLPARVSPGIQEAPGRAGRAGAGQPHHRDHRQRGGERRERGSAPGRGRFGAGVAALGSRGAAGSRLLPERTKRTRSAGSAGDFVVVSGQRSSVKGLPFSTLPNRMPQQVLINCVPVSFNFL